MSTITAFNLNVDFSNLFRVFINYFVCPGQSSTHYTYQETTSLVRSIDINEPNFEMRVEYKYHAGIVKDEKIKYGSKSGLDNAHFRYQYDGNARISGIDVEISGKQLPQIRLKYDQNLGILEGINDLRNYRNQFNRSVMQDASKQYFTVTDYDEHGRVKTILMNIRSLDVFRMELEYDNRNRIKMRKLMIGELSNILCKLLQYYLLIFL